MKTDLLTPIVTSAESDRWHGAIDGIHNRLVYGWAIDRMHPNARVVIEVTIDGEPCACVVADFARPDMADRIFATTATDTCHGFVADLSSLPAGTQGILSARVANTDVTLAGSAMISEAKTPPATVLNSVIGDGGLRLFGWAVDPVAPHRTLTVRAFVNNELIAETVANIIHPSARAYVDGPHAFELTLPSCLADGRTHEVRIVDHDGNTLTGSPVIVCCRIDGLNALLPDGTDSLTREVAATYERMVPRSLPMSAWAEWASRFEIGASAALSPAARSMKVGFIITGAGEEEAQKRTIDSLRSQGVAVHIEISSTFSAALADVLATGPDVIGCIRSGDTLVANSLSLALEGFALPNAQIVYTDSEHNSHPWLKPAWNADYALASDYVLELLLVRSTLAKDLTAVNNEADFAWSSLKAVWQFAQEAIVHVPRVVYRIGSPFTAQELASRSIAASNTLKACESNLQLEDLSLTSSPSYHSARRVHAIMQSNTSELTISLIIPTRDRIDLLRRCLDSIARFTNWQNLEIIVIDNGSIDPHTHDYFTEIVQKGVRVLPMPGPFNYADLNNRAVNLANGQIVGLINNDIEALHEGWLDEIISHLMRPNVGAVGAKLLWPNGMVQHGGVVIGLGHVAGHFGNRLADADPGDHGRNQLVQQVSACTAACLFLRRADYINLGGMDTQAFPVAFNDVDLCLKIRSAGKTIVWTPHAKLLHAESASRGHEDTPQKRARAQREIAELRRRWGHALQLDPAYHPSLNLDPNSNAFSGLAIPPRDRRPRLGIFPSQDQ